MKRNNVKVAEVFARRVNGKRERKYIKGEREHKRRCSLFNNLFFCLIAAFSQS